MKVIVHGSTGRMGSLICSMLEDGHPALSLCARVSPEHTEDPVQQRYTELAHYTGEADVVIDFSHHTAVGELMRYCVERHLAVVVATTGHTAEEIAIIHEAAQSIPVFYAANMSIGVALVAELAKRAAAMFPQADIEIIEKHHNQKLDVPSGTALLLARRICEARTDAELVVGRHTNGKRRPEEIGIHSLRLGNEVGTHEIILSTGNETITIKHEAESRTLFADGALAAAAFVGTQPAGLYSMQDMINS